MGRDPKTMNGRKLGDGMIHVSYRRPDDGKRWEARCEMVGDNQLRWAAFNAFGDGQMGRWRSEDRIDLSIADGKMKVDVSQSGTSVNSESFSLKSLSKSEERRVGKKCDSSCRSRGTPHHKKKKKK